MRVKIKRWHGVCHWEWTDRSTKETKSDDANEKQNEDWWTKELTEEQLLGIIEHETNEEESFSDEVCGICRQPFDMCCPQCRFPGDDCPPVWGECSHAFHMHCIMKWLQSQTSRPHCPMCRQDWNFRSEG